MEFLENLSPSLFTLKNVFLVKNNGLNLGNIYFPIDSQVFTFQPDRMDIKIFEVYKIDSGLDQIVKKYGEWNSRLTLDPMPLFERRKNMMGYKFSAETMPEPPYVIVNFDNLATGR